MPFHASSTRLLRLIYCKLEIIKYFLHIHDHVSFQKSSIAFFAASSDKSNFMVMLAPRLASLLFLSLLFFLD